jgi:CTP synthase
MRAEILELPTHPFFIGVQFHPEYKSRPMKPVPLFVGLLKAGLARERAPTVEELISATWC